MGRELWLRVQLKCASPGRSSHSLAEVEKMELIYSEEQIKINLSPFFLCILKGWHALLQLCRATLGLL